MCLEQCPIRLRLVHLCLKLFRRHGVYHEVCAAGIAMCRIDEHNPGWLCWQVLGAEGLPVTDQAVRQQEMGWLPERPCYSGQGQSFKATLMCSLFKLCANRIDLLIDIHQHFTGYFQFAIFVYVFIRVFAAPVRHRVITLEY